jgi:signal transduction histidine kinase
MPTRWRTLRAPDWRARSVVVGGLAVFVVGTYAVVVLGAGALLGRTGSPSLALSVLATAVVALGLEPAQRRLDAVVLRRGGRPPSPYEVLRRFGGTVVDIAEDGTVPERMARLLAEAVGAGWTQVWLTTQDRLVLVASWPQDAATDPAGPRGLGAADVPAGRREVAVRHGGRVYGVLRVQHDEPAALSSVEAGLVSGLAAQAGPVLRLLSLRADLAAHHDELLVRTDELRRSRARLIETQDAARRRLERDLHDGAQQHLVALAVNLRLAQTVAARSPQRAAAILAGQAEAARTAMRTLTELSRGLPPSRLTDEGLVRALRAALAGDAEVVHLDAGDLPRLPDRVEAALYFVVMEAVQNAGKHASGATVTVRLGVQDGVVVATVDDDGAGFDVGSVGSQARGTGLDGMQDRMSAVGGLLGVATSTGRGTRIRASVPVPGLAPPVVVG